MNKYEKLIADWEAIPSKQRSGRLARQMAKTVKMKSMLEVIIAAQLEFLKTHRKIKDFEYEAERWEYQHKVQHYTPDFRITLPNGNIDYYETKGKMDYATRKKIVSVVECNPDKSFKMIFERSNNKIISGSKTTYGDWCDSLSIPWSEKEIPAKWI